MFSSYCQIDDNKKSSILGVFGMGLFGMGYISSWLMCPTCRYNTNTIILIGRKISFIWKQYDFFLKYFTLQSVASDVHCKRRAKRCVEFLLSKLFPCFNNNPELYCRWKMKSHRICVVMASRSYAHFVLSKLCLPIHKYIVLELLRDGKLKVTEYGCLWREIFG